MGTGTGFFFNLTVDEDLMVPLVITNKHVVKGKSKGKFFLTQTDSEGNPILQRHFKVGFDVQFEQMWTFHPDPMIDLCAMPIGQLLSAAKVLKANLFYKALDQKLIPTSEQLRELDVVEDIFMIGYPNGIWDSFNNKPIIRKGITATHPKIDYNGNKEFMIDAACFPGSSGSPVIIYNNKTHIAKDGRILGQGKLIFLGVLYAGPQHTATGELKIINVPTVQKEVAISRIPNNLGIVIRSEEILGFVEIFKKKFKGK